MARVSYSPIVSSVSGSVGCSTFRNDRGGGILYVKPLPSRKQSEGQLYHRSIISASAHAWSNLDSDIQRAWNNFAASESIPSYFSRGRRWRGKDLFSCFFIYAEHQLTPLPARWLPTPPLFFNAPFLTWLAGHPGSAPDYLTYVVFMSFNPTDINATYPDTFSTNHCSSFFAGYLPFGGRKRPRQFVKVAPACQSANAFFVTPPDHYSAFSYGGWQPMLDKTIGAPPGLPFPTVAPISSPYSVAVARFCVTDARLFYSPITFGDPHYDPYNIYGATDEVNNTIPVAAPTIGAWGATQDIPTTEY